MCSLIGRNITITHNLDKLPTFDVQKGFTISNGPEVMAKDAVLPVMIICTVSE